MTSPSPETPLPVLHPASHFAGTGAGAAATSASTPFDRGGSPDAERPGLRGLLLAGLDLVLPRPCPGCGDPTPWCPRCAAALDGPPRRVRWPTVVDVDDGHPTAEPADGVFSRTRASADVRARAPDAVMYPAYSSPGPPQVWALARYADPVRAAILAGKEHGRRDLPEHLGQALGRAVAHLVRVSALPTPLWLVPAPSRRSSARRRGGDPVTAMARRAAAGAAAAIGRPFGVAPCLFTDWRAADSVGLDARDRADNLRRRVRWNARCAPPDSDAVLIVDDVFTTGATIAAAADVLRRFRRAADGALVVASASPFDSGTGPG